MRARESGDRTLDTARVFTALSLFALLSEPLASLVMALATFLGAVGSFARIQQFITADERVDQRAVEKATPTNSNPQLLEAGSGDSDAITVTNADIGWDADKPPQLRGVSFSVPKHKFTMIVGPVGCGKTTLLHAFLGEISPLSGSGPIAITTTSVAYCAQNAWHINGTVREAILSNSEFDQKWYDRVVDACALREDLRRMPLGDLARIGTGGIALSGGQSQRIVSVFILFQLF